MSGPTKEELEAATYFLVKGLIVERDRYKQALEFYSRAIDYNVHYVHGYGIQRTEDKMSRIDADGGETARKALQERGVVKEIYEQNAENDELLEERDALQKEVDEQCRLNGMGAQRELKLLTERDALRAALEEIMRVGTTGDGNTVECTIAYEALGKAGHFDK